MKFLRLGFFNIILLVFTKSSYCQDIYSEFQSARDFSKFEVLSRDSSFFNLSSSVKKENLNTPQISLLPVFAFSRFNSSRPYGWNDLGLNPNVGFQQYLSTGFSGKWKFISIKFQPEFFYNSNFAFDGFSDDFTSEQIRDRFQALNRGDFPEFFGLGPSMDFWWGQSKIALEYGSFELKMSTENFWWGPGQWNALTFSNNAQGFPHLSINTTKPAKTFLGNFESHLLIGKLQDSGLNPLINDDLNQLYFKEFNGDFKYLNAFMFSYNPKWVKGLTIGFARTFQVYNDLRENTFLDWLPVFEGFQKKNFFENGNTVDFDANGRDQQVTVFGKFIAEKALTELYFEFGKRDHNFSWREFILNPEHARAYIFGFNKLIRLPIHNQFIQIRGEVTHQQESVNRYIRYSGLKGNNSWHTHFSARGFSNFGQALGIGTGLGSNIQTIEISKVEGLSKYGLLFERVDRDADYFYKALAQSSERKPWIDLSLGFLFDKQFDNLLLSSKLQLIHARNYQWQLDPASTPEFPKGENLTSIMAQTSLIYFWKRKEK